MGKIGFVYAGQGSQVVGMGKSFYDNYQVAKDVFDQIDLDIDVKKLCFEGPIEELSKTSNTQPCMVAVAVVATKLLKENGINPDYVAGLSLGEYSALNAAGVLDDQTAINLVRFRGQAMEEAAAGIESKMIAIIGLDRDLLNEAVNEASELGVVSIANYNCPGQLVIGGEAKAVTKASELALEKGSKNYNVNFIIFDELKKISILTAKKWYKTHINPDDGMWIGKGFSNQYNFRISNNTGEIKKDITDKNFAISINDGNAKIVKILNTKEDESNE